MSVPPPSKTTVTQDADEVIPNLLKDLDAEEDPTIANPPPEASRSTTGHRESFDHSHMEYHEAPLAMCMGSPLYSDQKRKAKCWCSIL